MATSSARVLLVEDDPSFRELLVFALYRFRPHCQLAQATNGFEGYTLYQQQGADLIITDDQMPLMRGIDLIHTLRTNAVTTPILLLSSEPQAQVAVTNDQRTVFATKPILMDRLLHTVDTLLGNTPRV